MSSDCVRGERAVRGVEVMVVRDEAARVCTSHAFRAAKHSPSKVLVAAVHPATWTDISALGTRTTLNRKAAARGPRCLTQALTSSKAQVLEDYSQGNDTCCILPLGSMLDATPGPQSSLPAALSSSALTTVRSASLCHLRECFLRIARGAFALPTARQRRA